MSSRVPVVRGRCAIAGFVRVASRALVGMQQKRRGVDIHLGACARVAGRVARPDVNSLPSATRLGSYGVRSGRSHKNLRTNGAFDVAPLGSCKTQPRPHSLWREKNICVTFLYKSFSANRRTARTSVQLKSLFPFFRHPTTDRFAFSYTPLKRAPPCCAAFASGSHRPTARAEYRVRARHHRAGGMVRAHVPTRATTAPTAHSTNEVS